MRSEEVANHICISTEDHGHGGTISSPLKKSFYDTIIGKMFIKMTYIIPILWFAVSITLDPLYFYGAVIDDQRKCIKPDPWVADLDEKWPPWGFAIDVVSLCSLVIKGGLLKKHEKLIWLPLLLLDILSYDYIQGLLGKLPIDDKVLSKVDNVLFKVEYVIWPTLNGKNYYAVNFHLLYYFSMVILMYLAFTRIVMEKFAKATWAMAAFNLLLYIYGGYVYGSLWYNSAVKRNLDCWMEACKTTNEKCTSYDDLFCGDASTYNRKTWDGKCSTKTNDFDFGIYKDAIDDGIIQLHKHGISGKILYCLRWGLQNLSGFGQNLTGVSTDKWENGFVISMTIYGMMLFTFFIGNIQMYLQEMVMKSKMRSNQRLKIQKSNFFPKLSKSLQKQIKNYGQDNLEEFRGIKFDELPPSEFKRDIKLEICRDTLVKVDAFKCWNRELLDELCDYAKSVSYPEHAQILESNESIDKVLFVLHGKLQLYSFMNRDVRVEEIEDGKLCGEELLNWFGSDPYSSSLPISTITVETITEVEAFVLMHYHIKTLFIKHQKASESYLTTPNSVN